MRILFAFVCLVLLSLGGCGSRSKEISAPKVYFGQDVCHKCAMIISDERFAGAIGIRREGRVEHLLFDDVGEMLEFVPTDYQEIRWFTTDAVTRQWLDAESAFYLRSDKLVTPMGTGIGAYATRQAAEIAQQEYGGTVESFTDLRPAS